MNSTTMAAIVGLIVAVMLASVADAQQLPIPSLPTGVSRGNPNAPIHLVEFLDYQCLHCKEAYPIVEQVLNYYGSDKIYYTAHTYPLWLHRSSTRPAARYTNFWPAGPPPLASRSSSSTLRLTET